MSVDPRSTSTVLLQGYVTLGKSLHLSGPQFPHPRNGEDTSPSQSC